VSLTLFSRGENSMSSNRWTPSIFALFLVISTASADEPRPPDPLFLENDVLEVRLIAPIGRLLSERPLDEEFPGTFEYTDADGDVVALDVKVRARGRFRHNKDNCRFPPVRLNFKGAQTKGTLFHKQDKLKLVTHCKPSARYEQGMLSEYAAYRFLNVITEQSFKARLLKITYVDSDMKRSDDTRYAFIIEHKNRLAKRMEKPILDIPNTSSRALDPEYSSLVWLYHYLIGNTDFSPIRGAEGEPCCHNHVLFGHEGEKIWSIPYDFDQAGIVNAPYAVPAPQFRIRSVRQRVYRGRCVHNDYLADAIATYQDRRAAIFAVFDELDMASNRNLKLMRNYVEQFYKTLASERRVISELIKECN
jgi:hypothetical protein